MWGAIATISSIAAVALILGLLYRRPITALIDRAKTVNVNKGGVTVNTEAARGVAQEPEKETVVKPEEQEKKAIAEIGVKSDEGPVNWRSEVIQGYISRDMKLMEKKYEEASTALGDSTEKLKIRVMYLYFRFLLGDSSALPDLFVIAKDDKQAGEVRGEAYHFVGMAHMDTEKYDRAAEAFELASGLLERQRAVNDVALVADCLHKSGNKTGAYNRLEIALGASKKELAYPLYETLARLLRQDGRQSLSSMALELALDVRPNDTSLLFDAAFNYAGGGFRELALFHYKHLLTFAPDNAAALNNLGILFEELGMQSKGVDAYRSASEKGSSIAVANLAKRLIRNGFVKEAEEVLHRASGKEDKSSDVGNAIAYLGEVRDEEKKTEEAVIERGKREAVFALTFGEARFYPGSSGYELGGTWKDVPGVEMTLTCEGNAISGNLVLPKGKYELDGKVVNRSATAILSKLDPTGKVEVVAGGSAYLAFDKNGPQVIALIVLDKDHHIHLLRKSGRE